MPMSHWPRTHDWPPSAPDHQRRWRGRRRFRGARWRLVVAAARAHGAAADDVDVGRELERGVERLVQVAVFDDPGQRAGMGAEGIEHEVAGLLAVAVDDHGVDRRDARGVERAPYLQRRQQGVRRMVERIDAHVPSAAGAALVHAGAGRRHQQGDAVAGLGEAQRRGFGDGAIADDADIAAGRAMEEVGLVMQGIIAARNSTVSHCIAAGSL